VDGRHVLWYASDLAAGERQLDTMELRVPPTKAKTDLIRTVGAFATVLARVVDASPPGARGWHSMGQADASGFAAMACDELLVHTDDAARGLGVPFTPPHRLVRATLARLFPWAPTPLAGPAVVQRPRRPPRPAPPGPLGLALRPPRGVGRPQPGQPPLTRFRHPRPPRWPAPGSNGRSTSRPVSSGYTGRTPADPTAAGVGGGG
jgi:hypothetical protein